MSNTCEPLRKRKEVGVHTMKRKIASYAITSAIILTSSNSAVANFLDNCNFCLTPYIGAEVQRRTTNYVRGFGDNLYNKNFAQANFFLGLKFCDYAGIELGYETTNKSRRIVNLPKGSTLFGQDEFFSSSWDSRAQLNGWNINLMGFVPLSENIPISLFGSVGIAILKCRVQPNLTMAVGNPELIIYDATKTRPVLRLTTGIQYMLLDCLGVRGSIGWENTSKFGNFQEPDVKETVIAKFKDSVNFGLGLFVQF